MASIIETGQHEAIKLEWLDSKTIFYLDKQGKALEERNGGFADWLLEIRSSALAFFKIVNETYPLKFNKKTTSK